MQIHQLISKTYGEIHHRQLSCYCQYWISRDRICSCHHPQHLAFNIARNLTAEAIEHNLMPEQISKFEKRLEEVYDVTIIKLSTLSPEEKQEYIYWKAWHGAKFSNQPSNKGNSTIEEGMSDEEKNAEEDQNIKSDAKNLYTMTLLSQTENITEQHYYAVFYRLRQKKTFYIGRPIEPAKEGYIKIKYLEKKCGVNEYDWPRSDDIEILKESRILCQVNFVGPPPYKLEQMNLKRN
ncbi:hypothetical protein LOTGIDRAFT_155074 [Lottia gigantea]|uniref:Uncharacterized protein n=1 Tax=Lottia gigantea TaxID=225164 RepID=V3ZXA0_LOTGI|nr:hypothetical protein LOTGIDRAFT_155074 [Lottia gigantea]ESO85586.1 hypothetical protein LOTGIDRAFT_155074 [Lottia gigantea]